MTTKDRFELKDWGIGGKDGFFLISGPCVIESENHCLEVAQQLKTITARLNIPLIFKASYDKANRTSIGSYRGPGLEKGLRILESVRDQVGLPVLSDVHDVEQARVAGQVLDVLQIPAFLCRQTDLILAAASTGRPVNVKKGQFLSPWDMKHVIEKAQSVGCRELIFTERGTSFGYNNLVVDFKSLPVLRSFGYPVVFDATHSAQLPGGGQGKSSGQAEFIPVLARAAAAAGVDGFFFEVHDCPESALSDGPNSLPLNEVEKLLSQLKQLDQVTRSSNSA